MPANSARYGQAVFGQATFGVIYEEIEATLNPSSIFGGERGIVLSATMNVSHAIATARDIFLQATLNPTATFSPSDKTIIQNATMNLTHALIGDKIFSLSALTLNVSHSSLIDKSIVSSIILNPTHSFITDKTVIFSSTLYGTYDEIFDKLIGLSAIMNVDHSIDMGKLIELMATLNPSVATGLVDKPVSGSSTLNLTHSIIADKLFALLLTLNMTSSNIEDKSIIISEILNTTHSSLVDKTIVILITLYGTHDLVTAIEGKLIELSATLNTSHSSLTDKELVMAASLMTSYLQLLDKVFELSGTLYGSSTTSSDKDVVIEGILQTLHSSIIDKPVLLSGLLNLNHLLARDKEFSLAPQTLNMTHSTFPLSNKFFFLSNILNMTSLTPTGDKTILLSDIASLIHYITYEGIPVITIGNINFDYVLNIDYVKAWKQAVEEFVGDTEVIDEAIWTKYNPKISYDVRLTEDQKDQLDQLHHDHVQVILNDAWNGLTADVLINKLDYKYEPSGRYGLSRHSEYVGHEQTVNGGFETGDLTGYEIDGDPEIITSNKHGGVYACRFSEYEHLWQDFPNIATNDITSSGCWLYYTQTSGPNPVSFNIYLVYNSGYTTVEVTLYSGVWTYVNLKSSMEADKLLAVIEFFDGFGDYQIDLDDFSVKTGLEEQVTTANIERPWRATIDMIIMNLVSEP